MNTTTEKTKSIATNVQVGGFIGKLFSFNSSLKLYHWRVTGKGSYAQHIALDQAIASLLDVTDRIAETSFALLGDLEVVVPETKDPDDIIKHTEAFFSYVEDQRKLFSEAFSQAIIDDYQEAMQQLLYRLKRLQ